MGIELFKIQEAAQKADKKQKEQKLKEEQERRQLEQGQQYNSFSQQVLVHLQETIFQLPARQDLKKMLKKCIYGVFTNQKIDAEINFLCEVRQFLNKVRDDDIYYIELLNLLELIYQLAVDKQISNQFNPDFKANVPEDVDPTILAMFAPEQAIGQNVGSSTDDGELENDNENGIYIFEENEIDEYVIDEDIENNNNNNEEEEEDGQQQSENNNNTNISQLNNNIRDEIPQAMSEQDQIQEYDYVDYSQAREELGNDIDFQQDDLDDEFLMQQRRNQFDHNRRIGIHLQYNQNPTISASSSPALQIRRNLLRQNSNGEEKYGVIHEVDEHLYGSDGEHQ